MESLYIINHEDIVNATISRLDKWVELQTEHHENDDKRIFLLKFLNIMSNWEISHDSKYKLQSNLSKICSKTSVEQQLRDLIQSLNYLFSIYYFKFENFLKLPNEDILGRLKDESYFLSIFQRFKNDVLTNIRTMPKFCFDQYESLLQRLPEIEAINQKMKNQEEFYLNIIKKLEDLKIYIKDEILKFSDSLKAISDKPINNENTYKIIYQFLIYAFFEKYNRIGKSKVNVSNDTIPLKTYKDLELIFTILDEKCLINEHNTISIFQDFFEKIYRYALSLKIPVNNEYICMRIIGFYLLKDKIEIYELYVYHKNKNLKNLYNLFIVTDEFKKMYNLGLYQESNEFELKKHHNSTVETVINMITRGSNNSNDDIQNYINELYIYSKKYLDYNEKSADIDEADSDNDSNTASESFFYQEHKDIRKIGF